MVTIIAVIGLIWLYISFKKWMRAIKDSLNDPNYGKLERYKMAWNTFRHNPYGKDVKISLIFTLLGGIILAGVTGMTIGLIASAAISSMIWISKSSKTVNKYTNLA